MDTVVHTWQPMDRKLAEALQVARQYFGPAADQWPDDEVIHQLVIRALELRREIDDLKPRDPPPPHTPSQYSKF